MSTFRDLRDLVNVSRLTYRESDEEDTSDRYTYDCITPRVGFEYSNSSLSSSSRTSSSCGGSKYDPVLKKFTPNNQTTPNVSHTLPTTKLKQSISSLNHENRESVLLDRNTKLNISFSKYKKPLPPLNTTKNIESPSSESVTEESIQIDSAKTRSSLMKKKMLIIENYDDIDQKNQQETEIDKSNKREGNFDDLLTYIDASVVSEWLTRANRSLKKMSIWHRENNHLYTDSNNNNNKSDYIKYESFIQFANFWLGYNENIKLSEKQRRGLIEMEYSIICDEVMQAFQVGLESQNVGVRDVHDLLKAVFKEYPLQLLSFRGPYLVLDFIDILSSDRQTDYKNLLSDVKCRTINRQYAQWLLSIRSFAIINMCYSIIKFYKKTVESHLFMINQSINDGKKLNELNGRLSSLSILNNDKTNLDSSLSSTSSSRSSTTSLSSKSNSAKTNKRSIKSANINTQKNDDLQLFTISNELKYDYYLRAVFKNDYHDVLHYLITTKKCDPYLCDEHGRTLIFLAVMNDKPKILNYLVKRWPSIDINQACDSGNTPLHAAVNKGKQNLVEILLKSLSNNTNNQQQNNKRVYKLDVNRPNEKCMDATPLHLAVWNEYNEIALLLLQSNADPYLKMNGKNAIELAQENSSNEVLCDLINEYSQFK